MVGICVSIPLCINKAEIEQIFCGKTDHQPIQYNKIEKHNMSLSLLKSLKLQNSRVWSVDFASREKIIAIASQDHKIKLVKIVDPDTKQFKLLNILDETVHKKAVRSVAWRPHAAAPCLAAGSFDATVSIWSTIPGENGVSNDEQFDETQEDMELLAIIEGHENEIKGVSWSYDGMFLATCSRDKSVWIWETDEAGEDFECISVLQEHSQDVKHVVWHPRKYLLASSSYDDTIRLWSEFDDDWECVAILNGHEGTVWSSDFEKGGDINTMRLCSGSDDSTVRVWKYQGEDPDGQQEWICQSILPKMHERQVYSVSWNENGLIASTGSDGTLAVYKENESNEWEIIAKKELCHLVNEVNQVKWISISGKDYLITSGDDGCVNFWSYESK